MKQWKFSLLTGALAIGMLTVGSVAVMGAEQEETTEPVRMYRLYNPNSGEHFYTGAAGERDYLKDIGWNDEGIGWTAPKESEAPVYRLYNPNAGDHHYTLSKTERDHLTAVGWNYEGIGWYSANKDGGLPVYRQYNPNAKSGAHNFTVSEAEKKHLISIGWKDENIGWYAVSAAPMPKLTEKQKAIAEVYQSVVDKTVAMESGFVFPDHGSKYEGIIVCYGIADINKDGLPELIVGDGTTENDSQDAGTWRVYGLNKIGDKYELISYEGIGHSNIDFSTDKDGNVYWWKYTRTPTGTDQGMYLVTLEGNKMIIGDKSVADPWEEGIGDRFKGVRLWDYSYPVSYAMYEFEYGEVFLV